MQACREAKRRVAMIRRRVANKNGVIPAYGLDDLRLDQLIVNSKRLHPRIAKRRREPVQELHELERV